MASRLSDLAAAAFPELECSDLPEGGTRLVGTVRDRAHVDRILARFGDLGLDLVDMHRFPD